MLKPQSIYIETVSMNAELKDSISNQEIIDTATTSNVTIMVMACTYKSSKYIIQISERILIEEWDLCNNYQIKNNYIRTKSIDIQEVTATIIKYKENMKKQARLLQPTNWMKLHQSYTNSEYNKQQKKQKKKYRELKKNKTPSKKGNIPTIIEVSHIETIKFLKDPAIQSGCSIRR